MDPKEIKPIPNEELIGEKYPDVKGRIKICPIHNKEHWLEGTYETGKDGSVICTECGWGTRVPGYMRVVDGKVIDLRVATS